MSSPSRSTREHARWRWRAWPDALAGLHCPACTCLPRSYSSRNSCGHRPSSFGPTSSVTKRLRIIWSSSVSRTPNTSARISLAACSSIAFSSFNAFFPDLKSCSRTPAMRCPFYVEGYEVLQENNIDKPYLQNIKYK